MPFTPKFVDLVRNVTTVQGTGPVTLGAAVNGYTSLVSAAAPGEQFYYCIQGVDKPAEREVGRGTMQADGKVAREPINGGLTNFTSGTKTIALVTAAEWFARLDGIEAGGGGGGSVGIASRAELADAPANGAATLLLTEARREGVFVFESANLSSKVSADTAQGLYVAPASDPSGASGAWVRKFDGPVNPRWFGLVEGNASGANGAANSTALAAMLGALRARAVNASTNYQGLERVQFPSGHFEFASTIDLTDGSFIIEGADPAYAAGHATFLKFPAGVTGIRVHAYNTSGASGAADIPTHRGGQSIIRNLALRGAYAGTEADAHGIQLRGRAVIQDVYIEEFQGDGIYANATAGSGTVEGNANLSVIERCRIQECRNGIFFDNADSNACNIYATDCSSNRTWGFNDSSFLGNTYTGCHASANGWDGAAGSIPTACTYLGNRYYLKAGQAVGASTNAPTGTTADNTWWGYIGAGGTYNGIIAWVSGTTFREGGSYKTDDPNAQNVFSGCYKEGDQNPAQFVPPTLVLGGNLSQQSYSGALTVGTSPSGIKAQKEMSVGTDLSVGGNAAVTGSLTAAGVNFGSGTLAGSGSASITGVSSSFGRTSGAVSDSNFYLENNSVSSVLNFRRWVAGAPTVDAKIWTASGQLIIDHTSQIKLRIAGADKATFNATEFKTTTDNTHDLGSTALRWKSVNAYSGNFKSTLGYGTGAGGTVTQATSKSTGVLLDKACGQIVLNNAALAAGASASFTLSNSTIAAGDVVIINIQSGGTADAYELCVSAVAAGSCRVQLRNVSGGTLGEALVLNFAVIKAVAA